jgi:heptose I phosphotransferase
MRLLPADTPTSSLWHRLTRGSRRLRSQPDWDDLAGRGWADRVMHLAVTDRFHAKQGRSIGRLALTADGASLTVYLKRHYQLPRWQGVLATLFPAGDWSPGVREWRNLEWARRQGFAVPRAVASGEWAGPWGRLQSFLAVEELAGMLPLHEAVPLAARTLGPFAFAAWKRGLAAEMARVAAKLHGLGHFHKDLYLCHFYVAESDIRHPPRDWADRVYLIDLHRLARHRLAAPWFRVKDLGQLMYSSEVTGVGPRDRLRFWRAYNGGRGSAWLRRAVVAKWRLYRGHNLKHRAPGTE